MYLSEKVSYPQHNFYLFLLFSLQILVREEGEVAYQKGVDSGQTAKMETRVRTTTHQHIASESSTFVWTVAKAILHDFDAPKISGTVFLLPPFPLPLLSPSTPLLPPPCPLSPSLSLPLPCPPPDYFLTASLVTSACSFTRNASLTRGTCTCIALASFPGSPGLEHEHDNHEDGESLVSLTTGAMLRVEWVVERVGGGGGGEKHAKQES